ncbi:MAG: glycosyltransferase family 4 protein [Bacteroidetes bacterium]|nr:glycosyltransferase family 4 protein [Bacteroidota bacterium]
MTRRLVSALLRKVSGAVVLGDRLRWIFQGLVPDDRIFVIPNGADIVVPERPNKSGRQILYLSNLQPSKGIEDLVSACVNLSRDACEYELVISGAWWDRDTKRKVEELIDTRRITARYVGVCEDHQRKLALLDQADIFVFTPRSPEGHPWVLVEAMAAGLPIIATDKGAIAESVRDGENGFIVPSHRPDAIAEKLAILLEDKDLRNRLGKRSRQLYEQNFTEDKMIQRWINVIESVLART